jgi:hypothetical protein
MSTILDEPFDADTEKGSSFSLVPEDNYKAIITRAACVEFKSGRGGGVTVDWQIEGGDYDKRMVFQRFNLRHDSEEAQRIGREQFKDLCVALGLKGQITDLDVFLWKPARIFVKVRRDKSGEFPDRNEVGRVRPWVESWSSARAKKPQANAVLETGTLKAATATPATGDEMNDEIPW